jgi:hypothetical protein
MWVLYDSQHGLQKGNIVTVARRQGGWVGKNTGSGSAYMNNTACGSINVSNALSAMLFARSVVEKARLEI